MKKLLILLLTASHIHAEFVPIFDGKTLDGWQVKEGEEKWWRVKDGFITGGSIDEKVPHNTFLASAKSFQNFELTFQLRMVKGEGFQNTGMQIRSIREKNHQMKGYQVDGGIGYWGDLYDEGRRAKLCGPLDPEALKAAVHDWDWNTYRVLAEGPRIRVWINDVAVTDFIEEDPKIPRNGLLGLQAHGGGKFFVQIKNVMMRELPDTPNVSTWEKPKAEQNQTPDDQRQSFHLPDGFIVELVSSEEQGTEKPVTVAWDRHGKMWSMTAIEYPLDANENEAAAKALYAAGGRDRILVFDEPNEATIQTPRVFADGLAIPLGILPLKDGVLAQYGTEIRRYIDDNGNGKADRHDVILEGFGIQDSHLFVHQFERIPGGWIHLAQGAFNYSDVRRPGGLKFDDGSKNIPFNNCKLARFKPDGSMFEAQTAGPNNIWGLVISRTGETYIQEANDLGYPVTEFIPGANYPTPFGPRLRDDAPQKPRSLQGNQMGGTGLSGLALAEDTDSPFANDPAGRELFYVANPITSKIQIVTMQRDENGHPSYEKGPDFMLSDDKFFRPIACLFGPDGCLYIVDWYNKIISHNEVARAHPDRDKTSGRIWRVRHKDQPIAPRIDLAKLDAQQLLSHFGGPNARTSNMAWLEVVDRNETSLIPDLQKILADTTATDARRLAALWALEGLHAVTPDLLANLAITPQPAFRHEAVRIAGELMLAEQDFLKVVTPLENDPNFRVRAAVINAVRLHRAATPAIVAVAAAQGREPLTPGNRNAYDREFERYLARWAMSMHPAQTLEFMAKTELPIEAAILAARSLDGIAGAKKMVTMLAKIQRPLIAPELALLGAHIREPEILKVMTSLLASREQRDALLRSMLQLDASIAAIPELAKAVGDASSALLKDSRTPATERLVVDLARRFRIAALTSEVRSWTHDASRKSNELAIGLATLREMGALAIEDFDDLLDHADDQVRREAVIGFASLPGTEIINEFATRWPSMPGALRSLAIDGMTANPAKAETYATALAANRFGPVDVSALEKISAALGNQHPAVQSLLKSQEGLLKQVIRLNGDPAGRLLTNITLNGPFTVECWIRLNEGIGPKDGILGRKGGADFNFFDGTLRVYGGPGTGDLIVASRPVKANEWIHCAITRDKNGNFTIYLDGEPDPARGKKFTKALTGLNIGETTPPEGASASYDEYRIWNIARTAEQIRLDYRTSYSDSETPAGLVMRITGDSPGVPLEGNARVFTDSHFPELVTPARRDETEKKFLHFRALAERSGDLARGRVLAESTCLICHQVNGSGMAIGPDLSGAGAMGIESLLRNILTPNEQLESGYYRHDIRLADGTLVSGFLAAETKESITIRRIGADELVIPKNDITTHDISRRSLMPEGLIDGFTEQQVSDLFTYLNSLK